MSDMIERFQNMLDGGQDSAMLRFSLGNALATDGQKEAAIPHLERALELDGGYSAAWKLLAKTLVDLERSQAALSACERGIAIATEKGDLQAAKEMEVYAKRARKQLDAGGSA
ncbi:TPR repeat-containing protein [Thioalkalivibrio sp. K90mix]|uniref:tetratricopeptide repeat protein n=1 Tax=Thioalkalivibrio sp. (strain K90mix) TaxID=396595 RepID=UPI0001959D4F|nr:tetratricopeptide repeat protein [Thioalkalivibrio sp. K90mix]ADC72755.1 TPR repeat-containing protein [Thioalkalivibrio sp. K90mix]